jgi:glucose/mannose transport system substrate-binding protein
MPSRRQFVTAAATVGTVSLAGCSGGSGDGDSNGDGSSDGGGGGDGGGSGQEMEIMIAWTGEDGAAGFDALHEGFKSEHPDVDTVINDNPGGAGTGLATALDTRMFNEDPPSTWGFFPGPDLTDYAEAGLLGDITEDVWEQANLVEPVPEYIRELCQFEEIGYVAVPIEFNRLNNLFVNVPVVEAAGVDPASVSSPRALLEVMEQIESETDAVGMAQSTQAPWTVLQLWEAIHLGEYSFDTYTSFLDGNVADQESEIKDSLSVIADYSEYFNEDSGSVNFTEATSQFIAGDAAFLHQGDWSVGNFNRADDFAYDDDWLAVPFPGSGDVFMGQNSAFMYPTPNPTPEATKQFLRYAGSVDAQLRFNSLKGGIPCRNDAPMDDEEWTFNEHQQAQYEDFLNAENLIGTIAHNNVVVPQIASNVSDVFSNFKGSWDVDAAYDGLVDAFDV